MIILHKINTSVKQIRLDLNTIVSTTPYNTLSFDFHGTTLYIKGIRQWSGIEEKIIILTTTINKELAIPAMFLLEELQGEDVDAKVLLQGYWMLYDLKKYSDDTIFRYDKESIIFDWEDCDIRLLTPEQLTNDLQSFSEYPDRKVTYLDEEEKVHYLGDPKYIADYGIYVMRENDTECATTSSLLKVLSGSEDQLGKGVVIYLKDKAYCGIRYDSAGVFFEDKDGDDDITAFRLGDVIRDLKKEREHQRSFYMDSDLPDDLYCLELKPLNVLQHKSVDLGLSVNWATCNVGAKEPSDNGDFYAWGEVFPKYRLSKLGAIYKEKAYDEKNYKFYHNGHYTKYCSPDSILNPSDDVAHTIWGGIWRLPTKEEFQELVDKCKWKWEDEGVKGYEVTGPNGNSIFLPAAGFYFDNFGNDTIGVSGMYWSSSGDSDCLAFVLDFSCRLKRAKVNPKHYGLSVRAVLPKKPR